MIEAISTLNPRQFMRTDWMLRLLLVATFPLASTVPLLGGSLATQGPISRQLRELAEEEIAIRCPIVSSIRRVSQTGWNVPLALTRCTSVYGSHAKCATTRAGTLISFRGVGHRLDLTTNAPLLC